MPPARRIAVRPYDPEWPRRFERERTRLEAALAPWLAGGVHHVGSTAVPGLAAKPIVDMVAGVRDLAAARGAFPPLERLGYRPDPHRPAVAHHFAKPARGAARFGLHLTEPGSDLWRERIAFRDALRREPALAAEYERLKRALAEEHPHDLAAYTAGKRDLVASVLASAGERLGRR